MGFKETRLAFADALKPALGKGWSVLPDPSNRDDVTRLKTVQLERSRVELAAVGQYLVEYRLLYMCPTGTNEDTLEDGLDTLLEALTEDVRVAWSNATRATFDDKYPGYTITLTGHSERTRRNA